MIIFALNALARSNRGRYPVWLGVSLFGSWLRVHSDNRDYILMSYFAAIIATWFFPSRVNLHLFRSWSWPYILRIITITGCSLRSRRGIAVPNVLFPLRDFTISCNEFTLSMLLVYVLCNLSMKNWINWCWIRSIIAFLAWLCFICIVSNAHNFSL